MALTLTEPLLSRMNSRVREPIVEVISTQFLPDKPFEGAYFNSSTTSERYSEMIFVTSGRIISVDVRGGNDIYFLGTDVERTVWAETRVYDGSATIEDLAIVELADGNIGVIVIDRTSGRALRRMVISQEGVVVTTIANVATYGAPNIITHVGAVLQSDGAYRAVYSHFDGTNYSLRTRTSADWLSWGAESTITLTGWTATRPLRHPYLIQTTLGGLLLFFEGTTTIRDDGTELKNIYYVKSDDNGATWSAPVNVTGYTLFGTNGVYPYAAEREDGSIELVYTEENAVLYMDSGTTGWEGSGTSYCNTGIDSVADVFYDEASGLAFALCVYTYVGDKVLCGIQVIDTNTWEVVKSYTINSSPSYHEYYANNHVWWTGNSGVGQRIAVKGYGWSCFVLNHAESTIKHYWFRDNVSWNVTKNVNTNVANEGYNLSSVAIDDSTNRLYMLWIDSYYWHPRIKVGYLDMNEEPGVGEEYQYTELFSQAGFDQTEIYHNVYFSVDRNAGYIIMSSCPQVSNWKGILKVWSIQTGNEIYSFRYPEKSSFPYGGMDYPVYSNGHIYGGMQYRTDYNQEERRGLADVDLASGSTAYHRPSFSTRDDYGIGKKIVLPDGRIAMVCSDGIATFQPSTGNWEILNGDNVPGFYPGGDYDWGYSSLAYMADKSAFFLGSWYDPYKSWKGVAMMSEDGVFQQGQYKTGTFGTGWTFGATNELTRGLFDSDMAVAIDDENVMWGKWTRRDQTEYSNKWASEGVTKDVSDLLITSAGVTLNRKIDGGASLDFSCTQGHLFDPNNLLSTWNFVFEKGRKVTLRFGERISGIEYWVEQGTFVVDTIRLGYKRGQYPDISVSCKDLSVLWERARITASEYFSDTSPDDVVERLLTTYGGLALENLALPSIVTAHTLYCQFIDAELSEVLKELADHFEYFPRFDVTGDYTWKRVQALAGTVNHTYSEANLIDFTPDDSYSSFTNRVTVKGESRDLMEVLHAEELVNQLTGTIGWWESEQTKKVLYSDDGEKTCRDPRLDVELSVKEYEMFVLKNADADEYISDEDPNGKWCIVTITSTDYTFVVIGLIVNIVALGAFCALCDGYFFGYGAYCGYCLVGLTIMLSGLFYILGSIGTYQYNIYAKTIGSERLMIQCTANDTEFQQKFNGLVIEESIDDPYCYSSTECCRVANYELEVVKAQRKRGAFTKLADLRDEEGDILQLPHPHTGQAMKYFVTDLTRVFKKPEGAGGGEGGITDQITGWRHVTG